MPQVGQIGFLHGFDHLPIRPVAEGGNRVAGTAGEKPYDIGRLQTGIGGAAAQRRRCPAIERNMR